MSSSEQGQGSRAKPMDANQLCEQGRELSESLDTEPDFLAHAMAGIGTDIIYVHRIERALVRFGERFLKRVLGVQEIEKYRQRAARDPKRGVRFLATRFAAKEAFSKAIGLGMRMPMHWSAMQTLNAPSGKPIVVLAEPLKSWYEQRYGVAHVSLTDESDLVMAFVMVEQRRAKDGLQ